MVMFKMAHAQSKLIERMSCKGESQSILVRTEGETMKGEFWDPCVGLYLLISASVTYQELPDPNQI